MDDVIFDYGPAVIIRELEELVATTEAPKRLPTRLKATDILQRTGLFQYRPIDPYHTKELVKAINNHGSLDPLLVMQVGTQAVLLNGHHRVEAYRQAGVTEAVPVSYFEGTIEEAVTEAGMSNNKTNLNTTSKQRHDFAWRLVLLGGYSKEETRVSANVSNGLVGKMRRVKKVLGEDAFKYDWWSEALDAWTGRQPIENTSDDWDDWVETQAAKNADKMYKAFAGKLVGNITVAARTLEKHFGGTLPDLLEELGYCPYASDAQGDGAEYF